MRPGRALPLLALAGAVAWLFREVLFFGGVYFKRDIHLVWHPQVEGFVRCIAAGSWPLWDPSPAFGQPLLADPSAQVLYPLTWLNLLARPATYYTLYAVAHFILAAAGMRALARRLGLSLSASLVAAAIFSLSGPYLSMLDLWHHFAGASWMPWVVLALDRALAGGRRHAARFALTLALQILAGSADLVAMTLLVGAALGAKRHLARSRPWPQMRGALLRAALGGLLGVGLSAVLWMPALELAGRAARADLPAAWRTYWSVHPAVALELVLPGLWSALPLERSLRAAFFESREPFLGSIYLGVPALGLVAAGAIASGHPLRRLLLGVLLLATLVAMGPHTPVYGAVVTLLPPLQILRYPVKALALTAFAWALLAGTGADAWREADRRGRAAAAAAWAVGPVLLLAGVAGLATWMAPSALVARLIELPDGARADSVLGPAALRLSVTSGLAALVCALAVAGRRLRLEPSRQVAALAALAVMDLLVFHRSPNPVAPALLYRHRPEVLATLDRRDPGARTYVYDYSVPGTSERQLGRPAYAPARVPEGFSLEAASALGMQMYLAPETAGRWGVLQAFNVDYRGLHPAPLTRLTGLLLGVEETPLHLRLLQLGGVEHALSLHPLPGLVLEREVEGLFEPAIRLQQVPSPLGRTYTVAAARLQPSDDEAARLLLAADFDLRREIVLAHGPERSVTADFQGDSRIVEARPDRLVIDAETNAAGFVVLLDSFDPGWRVRLDGRPAELLRANLAFRAVAVPPGRHRVELAYRPRGLVIGLALAGLSLALVAACLVRGRRP